MHSIHKSFHSLVQSRHSPDLTWRKARVVTSSILGNDSGSYNIPATSDEVLSLYTRIILKYDEWNEDFGHNHMIFDPLDVVEC